MKKGGYKIIDMGEKQFSPFAIQHVTGTYEAIDQNNKFAILLSGIVYNGKRLADTMVNFTEMEDGYTAIILVDGGMLAITIDEDDNVSVNPLQRTSAGQATTETAGLIKQIEHQPNATPATEDEEKTAPTVDEYNALVEKYNDLLGAMVEAEVMAEPLTFVSLEVGDNITGGQTIYVKKVQNIDNILQSLVMSSTITLVTCGSQYPFIYIYENAGMRYLRYVYGGGTSYINIYNGNTRVWNEDIEEDGKLVLPGSETGTITTLAGNGWNGVVIGKMA